jgi:hypothetical protein
MTLLRYSKFVLCIALTTGSCAQEHATPLPDAPDTQKPVVGVARNTKPPSSDGRKARLAQLSQISSKSPSGASFVANLRTRLQ